MIEAEQHTPSASFTEMTELVLPQHANAIGTAFGGTVLSWVDICGAIAAHRHCGRVAVTAAIDELQFRAPIRVGDVVRITAWVNATFRSSLEVEVHVEQEDAKTRRRARCLDAFLTFVCVDDRGGPMSVPQLQCQSEAERSRQADALQRREQRLQHR